MRIEKAISQWLPCSRKAAQIAIRGGRVRVDGEDVRKSSAKMRPDAVLEVDGRILTAPPVLVAFHKPPGVQCTVGDPLERPNLADWVTHWLALGLHPVGRLDADSEGLLLLCSDGAMTQRLLHPKHGVRKVYAATVDNPIPDDLGARLAAGIETAMGTFTAELLSVEESVVSLAVTEGKHRMVRRMLNNAGHPVVRLIRLQIGPYQLADLPAGQSRPEPVQ